MQQFEEFYERLGQIGVVPVVVLDRLEDALPLGKALLAGGLPAAEVTFRTPVAADAIAALHEAYPALCVGAGTVLTVEDVDRTVAAGGAFVVSPGFDAAVVQRCLDLGLPVLPAGVTPSEVIAIRNMGLQVSKFFPAETFGGLGAINALAAPFVGHRFMPTGGVSPANLRAYLSNPHVIACGGTWMVKGALLDERRYDEVERLCAEAAAVVRELRGPAE